MSMSGWRNCKISHSNPEEARNDGPTPPWNFPFNAHESQSEISCASLPSACVYSSAVSIYIILTSTTPVLSLLLFLQPPRTSAAILWTHSPSPPLPIFFCLHYLQYLDLSRACVYRRTAFYSVLQCMYLSFWDLHYLSFCRSGWDSLGRCLVSAFLKVSYSLFLYIIFLT